MAYNTSQAWKKRSNAWYDETTKTTIIASWREMTRVIGKRYQVCGSKRELRDCISMKNAAMLLSYLLLLCVGTKVEGSSKWTTLRKVSSTQQQNSNDYIHCTTPKAVTTTTTTATTATAPKFVRIYNNENNTTKLSPHEEEYTNEDTYQWWLLLNSTSPTSTITTIETILTPTPLSSPQTSLNPTKVSISTAPSSDSPTISPSSTPLRLPTYNNMPIVANPAPAFGSVATKVPTISPSFVLTDNPQSPLATTNVPTSIPSTLVPIYLCGYSDPDSRRFDIFYELTPISGQEALSNSNTNQSRAFRWLVEQDEKRLCPDAAPSNTITSNKRETMDIIQRYTMALFYFETGGETSWSFCGRRNKTTTTTTTDKEECLGGDSFLSPSHECYWKGVTCDDTWRVMQIRLQNNTMKGRLPHEISALTYLHMLSLDTNELMGTIPSSLGLLSYLRDLELDSNMLEGSIPESIYDMTSLVYLDLDKNYLTGTISNKIGNLSNLFFLQLDYNQFTGTLPSSLTNLEYLEYLTIVGNDWAESIPTDICNMPNLYRYADCDKCREGCCVECRNVSRTLPSS